MAAARLAPIAGGAFILGVIAANLDWSLFFLIFLIFGALALLKIASRTEYSLITFFAFCLLGFFYAIIFSNWLAANRILPESSISGSIISDPEYSGRYSYFVLNLDYPGRGRVRVRSDAIISPRHGDNFSARGDWRWSGDKKETPLFLSQEAEISGGEMGFGWKGKLYSFKNHLTDKFRKYLGTDASALAAGITLGDTSGFSYELKEDMKKSGTTHLVALSGYNISLVVTLISYLFGLWLSRNKSFWMTVLVILIFTIMTGAASSVSRAAIMGVLVLLAGRVGRFYDPERAIIFAASTMLLFDPLLFKNDLGFTLSFLSFAGMAYLEPIFKRFLGWDKLERISGWRENLLHTLSAQAAVLPLLMLYLGSFSPTSILANILVLSVTPFAMLLGFASLFAGLLFNYLGQLIAWFLAPVLIYQLAIIRIFSAWSVPMDYLNLFGPWPIYIFSLALVWLVVRDRISNKKHA